MKKILFMLLFFFFLVENSLATSQQGLRYRGKNAKPKYFFLIAEEEDASIDDGEIFSCLGKVWEAFKAGNFDEYFDELIQIEIKNGKNVPEALYLLGLVYEKGYGRIFVDLRQATSYYVRALVSLKEGTPLYNLALEALERRKTEALKESKIL